MIRVSRIISMLIAIPGIVHIGLGVAANVDSEVARLWFIGSGLAILFFSAFNLSAVDRLLKDSVISVNWVAMNVMLLSFIGYACWLLPEPQNYTLLLLIVLSQASSFWLVLEKSPKLCCFPRAHT